MMATGLGNDEFVANDANLPPAHTDASQPLTVKVTDYSYANINPSPIKLSKGTTDFLEEFLSPRKLQALTGVDNLDTVNYLEMRVNTDQMSLGNFGMYLPNLSQIKLSGSYIPTIRDLGTSLWNLQVLWMPQCSLHCLDGLVTMLNMRELYLAYNEIEDISSCGMLENLEILDLEGNHIKDTSNVHYLSMCTNLSRLTLEGNPICSPSNFELPMTYRKCILETIVQLTFLDDMSRDHSVDICQGDTSLIPACPYTPMNSSLAMEDHWHFINSMLLESGLLADALSSRSPKEQQSPADSGRPASSLTSTPTRPNSAMRPMSAQRRALATAIGRPTSSGGYQKRPTSATSDSIDDIDEKADDSSLTAGQVVCGSVTRSLRRGMANDHGGGASGTQTARPAPRRVVMDTSISASIGGSGNVEESCEQVLTELNQWRRDYERSRARIEGSKAPQVLTIDHSEDDIEQVVMPVDTRQKPPMAATKTMAPCPRKVKTDQLNPLKAAPRKPLPTSDNSATGRQIPVAMSHSTSKSVAAAQPPQMMSRMRRQLLQSSGSGGVSVITPSKPLLKR